MMTLLSGEFLCKNALCTILHKYTIAYLLAIIGLHNIISRHNFKKPNVFSSHIVYSIQIYV